MDRPDNIIVKIKDKTTFNGWQSTTQTTSEE